MMESPSIKVYMRGGESKRRRKKEKKICRQGGLVGDKKGLTRRRCIKTNKPSQPPFHQKPKQNTKNPGRKKKELIANNERGKGGKKPLLPSSANAAGGGKKIKKT